MTYIISNCKTQLTLTWFLIFFFFFFVFLFIVPKYRLMICSANQWNGFYVIKFSVMKELKFILREVYPFYFFLISGQIPHADVPCYLSLLYEASFLLELPSHHHLPRRGALPKIISLLTLTRLFLLQYS